MQWAQAAILVLSIAGFVIAVLPRYYSADVSELGCGYTMQMWPRLLRFPLFWFGLSLLVLIAIQALNPSWKWHDDGKVWWIEQLHNIRFLPTSADTPYNFYNVWRQSIIYAAAWLTVCAVWTAITRRKSLKIFFWLVTANAVLLTIIGCFQRNSSPPYRVLWVRDFPGAFAFGSFVYQNHAGAYLGLMMSLALASAFWCYIDGRRRMVRSSPASVWLLAALIIFGGVVASYSRGAMIASAIFAFTSVAAFVLRISRSALPSVMPRSVTASLSLIIICCVIFVIQNVDFTHVVRRFEELIDQRQKEDSYMSRTLVRGRAAQMLQDHWVLGTGAGSFRFLFPIYIKNDPYLYAGGYSFWEHAHIDWLEIPIELGLAGDLLIASAFGWILWQWWRMRGWRHPIALILLLGCLQTLGHALIDFPFQNTAILITWWSLLVIMIRWLEFDTPPTAAQKYFEPKKDLLR